MADIRTFNCRFNPWLPTRALKTFNVTVKWWAYDNDRLCGRGEPKQQEARIVVRGEDAVAARKLVVREWSSVSSFIGQALEVVA